MRSARIFHNGSSQFVSKIRGDLHTGKCRALSPAGPPFSFSRQTSPRFILNGLSNANEVLGGPVFDEEKWRVVGEYVHDERGGRHQAFYSPREDTTVLGQLIRPHDRIKVEQSLKYSAEGSSRLWETAGLSEVGHWSKDHQYGGYRACFLLLQAFRGALCFLVVANSVGSRGYPGLITAAPHASCRMGAGHLMAPIPRYRDAARRSLLV